MQVVQSMRGLCKHLGLCLFLSVFLGRGQVSAEESVSSMLENNEFSENELDVEVGESDTDAITPLDDSDESTFAPFCRRFDGNPRRCSQIRGCSYDYNVNLCLYEDDSNPVSYCSRYNFNYNMCVRSGCHYDSRSGFCITGVIPDPDPLLCSRFNFNQYACQRNGCFFDWRTRQCYGDGGGNPPYYQN